MRKYIFGPVPSRRLGISLGIDIVPFKICTLDCVYCEVGKTTDLIVQGQTFFDKQDLFAELEDYFQTQPDPDYITFSGSGEPTLNSDLKSILTFIKKKKPQIPVALLTNGTLLSNPKIRASILDADLILPSLDAATATTFKKINRPHPDLDLKKHIQGLVDLQKEYPGKIHLEIFILPGYNDNLNDLKALKEAILSINPDEIHLNTLDRPGLVKTLRSASTEELQQIKDFWGLDNISIISKAQGLTHEVVLNNDVLNTILATISRRPCTLEDLQQTLGLHINEINKYLRILENDKKIETHIQKRGIFYQMRPERV